MLAKEAAESQARLQNLSSNEYRGIKASQIGGGDIRRRQLGDIASILGGRPTKRTGTETPKKELEKPQQEVPRRVNLLSEEEFTEPVVRMHDDKTRSRRQLGDIAAILGGQSNKRKRTEDHKKEKRSRRADVYAEDEESERCSHEDKGRRSSGREGTGNGDRSRRRRSRDRSKESEKRAHMSERTRRRSADREEYDDRKRRQGGSLRNRHRRRSRSRSRSLAEHLSSDSNRRDRSPNPKRKSLRSPEGKRNYSIHTHRQRRSLSTGSFEDMESTKRGTTRVNYDSDPLDDIIGPPPPPPEPQVRTRGRGAISHGSGMDSRFSAAYDPTVDVQLDPDEENDWDQALEALRDRQKWKQSGADRLRAAGFTDEEVTKWENGGEKREEDVKWAKRGEGREWDRGKVVDEHGIVSHEPSWGRLKDT